MIKLLCIPGKKFSAFNRNSVKRRRVSRRCKKHLWHLKLRFAPLMIALSPVLPLASPGSPNVFRSECTCTHGAHKSECATWQRTRTSHKRLSAQVCMCLYVAAAEISQWTRACMQMHQIKCNYTRRKFTLGLHTLIVLGVSFARNSTSDKLQRAEKERACFIPPPAVAA